MKPPILIALSLVGAVALFFGIGYLLPTSYRVERSLAVAAPSTAVFAHVANLGAWPNWDPWQYQDPKIKLTYGPMTGPGAWREWKSEVMGNGKLTFTEVDSTAGGRRVAYDLQFEGWDPAQGSITLEPTPGGTQVKWVMKGKLADPLSRYFGLLMDGMVGPDFEKGLANLKAVVEGSGQRP